MFGIRGHIFKSHLISLLVASLLLFGIAESEGRAKHPFQADFKIAGIDYEGLRNLSAEHRKNSFRSIKPLYVSSHIFGLGNVTLKFEQASGKSWDSYMDSAPDPYKVVLLKGKIRLRGRREAKLSRQRARVIRSASGSLICDPNNRCKMNVAFNAPRVKFPRFYSMEWFTDAALLEARVKQAPLYALSGRTCAGASNLRALNLADHSGANALSNTATTLPATFRIIELATACDHDCIAVLGSSANAIIASFINQVDTIYARDLGLRFSLVNQVAYSSASAYPSSITDSEVLLNLFFSKGSELGSADVKHLITGKTLDDNVLGIAALGTVCVAPSAAVGLSTHFNSLFTPVTIAHEIGHNHNATHAAGGIMIPALSVPPPSEFSTFSKNEVASFVSAFGQCLAQGSDSSSSSSASSGSSSSTGSSSSGGGGGGGDDGDGGGGGANPDDTQRYSTMSLRYTGSNFRASIQIPEGFSNCAVTLKGAKSSRGFDTKAIDLGTGTIADSSDEAIFSATILPAKTLKSGATQKAIIGASFTCEQGGSLWATPRGVKISRKKGGTFRTVNQWLASLAGSVD